MVRARTLSAFSHGLVKIGFLIAYSGTYKQVILEVRLSSTLSTRHNASRLSLEPVHRRKLCCLSRMEMIEQKNKSYNSKSSNAISTQAQYLQICTPLWYVDVTSIVYSTQTYCNKLQCTRHTSNLITNEWYLQTNWLCAPFICANLVLKHFVKSSTYQWL